MCLSTGYNSDSLSWASIRVTINIELPMKCNAINDTTGDFFGSSLALSSLGGRIAVGVWQCGLYTFGGQCCTHVSTGARLHNGGNGALSGLVQVYLAFNVVFLLELISDDKSVH